MARAMQRCASHDVHPFRRRAGPQIRGMMVARLDGRWPAPGVGGRLQAAFGSPILACLK